LVAVLRQRLAGRHFESASHIVVCERQQFRAIARIEDVLAAPDAAVLADIMDRQAPVVAPGVDQEVAAWHAVRHSEAALAVVDERGRFVGLIPPHRLLAVLLSEHEEDLSRLGGFTLGTAVARATSEEPVERRFRHRVPWLLVGLGGALLSADFVGWFEAELRDKVMLAFFVPGIVYLADAVGTQTETVVVRGLAIGLAVLAACSTATLAAMWLPWLLDRLDFDPAFGSGPLATVVQDLLSILIYFGIAVAIMS